MVDLELKEKIINCFKEQGFKVNGQLVPTLNSKSEYREIHNDSKIEQQLLHRNFIKKNAALIKKYLRNGKEIKPENINLELREVKTDTLEERIFKWWNFIWWSVPYQRAYGRQMRFVLWDTTHNSPFGLIGLQSPILKMSVRDNYLNLPKENHDLWINRSMQAQRLGALPPYNQLIGGKLAALSLTSNELRKAYFNKYKDTKTIIKDRKIDPELLFITTTSAFGRSSIYNRLKYHNDLVAKSLGFTQGSGTFHIPEKLYKDILKYLENNDITTGTTFGYGPSRKVKLMDKAFSMLDLGNYSYHNVKREFFIFEFVQNLEDIIQSNSTPAFYNRELEDLVNFWKSRWCIPRSKRNDNWKIFNKDLFFTKTILKYF